MKHLGDITKINGAEIPAVDVVTGGSPCQDLSVAGKRAGLEGERSGLFMEQIRIIKEMRAHDESIGRRGVNIRPRYMVWENVDGARSSGNPKGEDFRIVLEETAKVADKDASIPRSERWTPSGCILGDGWSIAWRIHDAQFWGVAQRRRRIALVADFGGLTAPEILFERKGLQWNPDESEPPRETTPADTRDGSGSASYTLKVRGGAEVDSHGRRAGKGALIQDELSGTLGVSQDQTVFGVSSFDSNAMKSSNPESGFYKADTSRTLDNNGGNPACNQGGMAVVQDTVGSLMASGYEKNGTQEAKSGMYVVGFDPGASYCVDMGGGKSGSHISVDSSPTLACTHAGEPVVSYGINGDTAGTLDSHYYLGCGARGGKERDVVAQPSYGIDRSAYNQGENAKYDFTIAEESSPTIVARGGGAVATNSQQRDGEGLQCGSQHSEDP